MTETTKEAVKRLEANVKELRNDLATFEMKLVDLTKFQIAFHIATSCKDIADAKKRIEDVKELAKLL